MSKDIDELEQRIEQIKHKIIERNIQLNPCLEEHDVESFEAQYNIRLPEAYRRFLLEVGNGGECLPSAGLPCAYDDFELLLPLAETIVGFFSPDYVPILRPDLPFPFTDGWDDSEELSDEIEAARFEHGQLYLCNLGCDVNWILVITGIERGYLWCSTETHTAPCEPRRDFLSWYEYWLDNGCPPL